MTGRRCFRDYIALPGAGGTTTEYGMPPRDWGMVQTARLLPRHAVEVIRVAARPRPSVGLGIRASVVTPLKLPG